MLLSVMERILLLNSVLPREGSFNNLKLLRKARESLSFTEDENELLNFREEGNGQIIWNNFAYRDKETGKTLDIASEFSMKLAEKNPERFEKILPAVPEKDIEIGATVMGIIAKSMKDMDRKEKLTENHYSLYEKFVDTGKE